MSFHFPARVHGGSNIKRAAGVLASVLVFLCDREQRKRGSDLGLCVCECVYVCAVRGRDKKDKIKRAQCLVMRRGAMLE